MVNGSTKIFLDANGLIRPDYGRQFQAKAEFRSGRFFNYTRYSALAPVQKLLEKNPRYQPIFCMLPSDWTENYYYIFWHKSVNCSERHPQLLNPARCFPSIYRQVSFLECFSLLHKNIKTCDEAISLAQKMTRYALSIPII